jgi:hypothetical protein
LKYLNGIKIYFLVYLNVFKVYNIKNSDFLVKMGQILTARWRYEIENSYMNSLAIYKLSWRNG